MVLFSKMFAGSMFWNWMIIWSKEMQGSENTFHLIFLIVRMLNYVLNGVIRGDLYIWFHWWLGFLFNLYQTFKLSGFKEIVDTAAMFSQHAWRGYWVCFISRIFILVLISSASSFWNIYLFSFYSVQQWGQWAHCLR